MAFGSSWRNRCAAYEGANQESRKAGIIVEAFVPNAWRLAETQEFPLRQRTLQQWERTMDSSITVEIDLSARW